MRHDEAGQSIATEGLRGKSVLITGSASGLGFEIACVLAQSGARVVLHDVHDEALQGAAVRLSDIAAASVTTVRADLSNVAGAEELHRAAVDAVGGIDILVCNAVVRHIAPITSWTPAMWEESLGVNLSSAFHLSRLVVPAMTAQEWGRIVFLSSMLGTRAEPDRVGYVTTKTALVGLMRAIAVETAGTGITCNAVSPGSIRTPAIQAKLDAMARAQGRELEQVSREYVERRHPTGRFVSAIDVAHLVSYLCGPYSGAITGSALPVDGGWSARA